MHRSKFYKSWIKDAQRLIDQGPEDAIYARGQYLLDDVAKRGRTVANRDLTHIAIPRGYDPERQFVVTEIPKGLDPAKVPEQLRGLATGEAIEQVNMVTAFRGLFLPQYKPEHRMGNAMILLHALQHLTEPEDGFPLHDDPGINSRLMAGRSERRAYRYNEGLLRSADGSDVDRYLASLPFDIGIQPLQDRYRLSLDTRGTRKVEPPADTMMHELWSEGDISRKVLGNTVVSSLLAMHTQDISRDVADMFWSYELNAPPAQSAG